MAKRLSVNAVRENYWKLTSLSQFQWTFLPRANNNHTRYNHIVLNFGYYNLATESVASC